DLRDEMTLRVELPNEPMTDARHIVQSAAQRVGHENGSLNRLDTKGTVAFGNTVVGESASGVELLECVVDRLDVAFREIRRVQRAAENRQSLVDRSGSGDAEFHDGLRVGNECGIPGRD